MISRNDLKALRIPIVIFSLVAVLFAYSGFRGYRLLDVFTSKEWAREGPPGPGSSGYHHK